MSVYCYCGELVHVSAWEDWTLDKNHPQMSCTNEKCNNYNQDVAEHTEGCVRSK